MCWRPTYMHSWTIATSNSSNFKPHFYPLQPMLLLSCLLLTALLNPDVLLDLHQNHHITGIASLMQNGYWSSVFMGVFFLLLQVFLLTVFCDCFFLCASYVLLHPASKSYAMFIPHCMTPLSLLHNKTPSTMSLPTTTHIFSNLSLYSVPCYPHPIMMDCPLLHCIQYLLKYLCCIVFFLIDLVLVTSVTILLEALFDFKLPWTTCIHLALQKWHDKLTGDFEPMTFSEICSCLLCHVVDCCLSLALFFLYWVLNFLYDDDL